MAKKPNFPIRGESTWLKIHHLKISCMVGIHNWEQHIPQNLYLDISFEYHINADPNDDIHLLVDYSTIADGVVRFCKRNRFKLLETWLDHIGRYIFQTFPQCNRLELTLSKPCALENAEKVAVVRHYHAPKIP